MASTTDLARVLSDAFGVERRTVDLYKRYLRDAGLLPVGRQGRGGVNAARAKPEHAAALLFSLMSGFPPAQAAKAVEVYSALPLERVTRDEQLAGGRVSFVEVPDDDPLIQTVRTFGATFGEFLSNLIEAYSHIPEADFMPGRIVVGGAPGTTFGMVYLSVLAEGFDVGGSITFGLTPLGGGYPPDDAAQARLERHASVPGEIFQVFRELFTDNSEGPRKAIIPRAEVTTLHSEGT